MLERAKAAHGELQILLCRDAADVDHGQLIRTDAPLGTQSFIASRWAEQLRVDRPRKPNDVVETAAGEELRQLDRRHECRRTELVETAQIGKHERSQRTETVMAGKIDQTACETGARGMPSSRAARSADMPSGPSVAT